MNYITFSVLSVLIFSACSQKPIAPDQIVQRFDSDAYYTDKVKNKSQQMNLEVVARKNQQMRLDAKVVLGLHIASVVMTNEKVEVALHAEKKAYEGRASQKVLQRSMGLPLHPLVFHAMVYRQAMKGAGWSCQIQNGKVIKCAQSPSGLTITWENQEDATMVTADSKTFNLQWRILPPENVQERPNYFQLKIPDSYEKLSL